MLKKYADRVKATYEYMRSTINFMDANYQKIKQMRSKWKTVYLFYPIKWEIDTAKVSQFSFLGLKQGIKKVKLLQVIGLYDRSRPKDIRYLKEYKSVKKLPYLQRILFQKRFGIYGSIKQLTFTRLAKIL
jgi:hypothetical protein